MGVGHPGYLLRGSRFDVGGDDEIPLRRDVLGPGGQLAVGEGSRPALAEGVVVPLRKNSRTFKPVYLALADIHLAAPLDQDGGETRPLKHQGGEEARRTAAYHHRLLCPETAGNIEFRCRGRRIAADIGGSDPHRQKEVDATFVPGIQALAFQGVPEIPGGNLGGYFLFQQLFIVIRGQF